MNFQQFVTTGFGTRLWMGLARWLPPPAGRAFARAVAALLHRRKESNLYRILYANQQGVLGAAASPEQVDRAVKAVLHHAGRATLDLMQIGLRGEEAVRQAVVFPERFWGTLAEAKAQGRGVLIAGCHLSNFNLAFIRFALEGYPLQVLSAAAVGGGFRLLSDLRERGALEETPLDPAALRKAIHRLRAGGTVATGVDWPYGAADERPIDFFGRPSCLPTGYIRLALTANALVFPIACRWSPRDGYGVLCASPLEMEHTGDKAHDVVHNARRVLAVVEDWIRETPDQWLMYHRVWPSALL